MMASTGSILLFQSTHPVGGGTWHRRKRQRRYPISIHPPRGGWDLRPTSRTRRQNYFNPPTPWGVGRLTSEQMYQIIYISIHPPRGGWDADCGYRCEARLISIHPPRGGWDRRRWCSTIPAAYFNPPTPWGVGRGPERLHPPGKYFNPPTPWGVGPSRRKARSAVPYFNPPTPWGVGLRRYMCP